METRETADTGIWRKTNKLLEELNGTKKQDNTARWSPPENYKKRVAALEAKQQGQAAVHKAGCQAPSIGISFKHCDLSKEDRAIAERLEKLKGETKPKSVPSQKEIECRLAALMKEPQRPIPSTREMEDRLAQLKGQTPPSQTPKPNHQAPDTRTQTEQVSDLLKQMSEETAIDEKCSSGVKNDEMNDLNKGIDPQNFHYATTKNIKLEEEKNYLLDQATAELKQDNLDQEHSLKIARRLATLKGEDPNTVSMDDWKLAGLESDEENEELLTQRILKQVNEEIAIDQTSGYNIPIQQPKPVQPIPFGRKQLHISPTPAAAETSDSDDELPWCSICNNDAVLRCHGCDGDLYCHRCFREGHDKFERKEHRTSKYSQPNKKK
ncbi:abscission/NoCut checkpoint regulator [Pristis pectinata]|uniref:abscission/NoCut checkpoint regulator n=1 Tax=Pristis pectinata TaxID=685728 RepID=UPI00223DE957|nr:abscission/NoCut checkpoint regulator [Pristis pectinata]